MFFRPRYLSILTTRRCTAACDHCCVGASPRAVEAIPVARIHQLIDEAARVPSIEVVGFTGGECFTLGRHLDALVAHAHAKGFRTRAITNGYWAASDAAAEQRVASLRRHGLDEIMFSTGDFHQRFVPVARIIAGARAAAEAGMVTRVSVEVCDQSTFDAIGLRSALSDLVESARITIGEDPWTTDAQGRGTATLTHENLLEKQPTRAHGRCEQILTVISVTPSQDVIACCGIAQEALPQLRLGSIENMAFDSVLGGTPPELLKMWLHVAGPSGIAEFVARYVPGYALPPSATICQACVALQRDDTAMRIISEHARDAIAGVVAAFTNLQQADETSTSKHLQLEPV